MIQYTRIRLESHVKSPHQIPRTLFVCLLCLQLLIGAGCREIYNFLFYSIGEPDPCDAGVNVYRGDTHFIERDFLLEDGTIDYEKWVAITDPGLSPCDPLNKARSNVGNQARKNAAQETPLPPNSAEPVNAGF